MSNWEQPIDLTILQDESLSDSVSMTGKRLFGIDMPATWTTANITIQGYNENTEEWAALSDENGNELTISATAGAIIRFSNPSQYSSVSAIKLLSGTTDTPVTQAADRTIKLITRSI